MFAQSVRSVRTSRSISAATLVVILAIGTLVACGSSTKSTANGSYKVKVIADLSGPTSAGIGIPAYAGIKAGLQNINNTGGVNGRQIDFSVIDGLSTPEGSQAAARQAVGANPVAIVGATVSSGLAAREQILSTAKIPDIDTAPDDNLAVKPEPWYYTSQQTSRQTTNVLATGIAQALGGSISGKKIAIEAIASAGADPIVNGLKKLISDQGGTVGDVERLAPGAATFASQAQNIVSSKADGLITIDIAPDSVTIAKAMITAGFTGPILASGASDDTSLKAVDSANFLSLQYVPVPAPGSVMATAAASTGGTSSLPNLYFGLGWTAAYMVKAALEKCPGNCSPADFEKNLDAIGSKVLEGNPTFGPIKITSTQHYAQQQAQIVKWDSASQKAVDSGSLIDTGQGEPPLT